MQHGLVSAFFFCPRSTDQCIPDLKPLWEYHTQKRTRRSFSPMYLWEDLLNPRMWQTTVYFWQVMKPNSLLALAWRLMADEAFDAPREVEGLALGNISKSYHSRGLLLKILYLLSFSNPQQIKILISVLCPFLSSLYWIYWLAKRTQKENGRSSERRSEKVGSPFIYRYHVYHPTLRCSTNLKQE